MRNWSRNLLRSSSFELAFFSLTVLAALFGIGILIFTMVTAASLGWDRLNLEFIFSPSRDGGMSGGIYYQIIGTLILVITASFIVTPLACAIGICDWLLRHRPEQRHLRSLLYILNATPSIIFGILGFLFFVKRLEWDKSWLAGGFTLALMILPTVTLALIHRLNTLPRGYLDTAMGLGLHTDQLIRSLLLPYAWGGLLTGLVMGIARAAGETAPIMFTAAVFAGATLPNGIKDNPVLALPYHIFNMTQDVLGPIAAQSAWATGFILIGIVLILSLLAAPLRSRSHEEARIV